MIIELENEHGALVILRRGTYYGCVSDKNGNIVKKGFPTREEARLWINNQVDAVSRWTE